MAVAYWQNHSSCATNACPSYLYVDVDRSSCDLYLYYIADSILISKIWNNKMCSKLKLQRRLLLAFKFLESVFFFTEHSLFFLKSTKDINKNLVSWQNYVFSLTCLVLCSKITKIVEYRWQTYLQKGKAYRLWHPISTYLLANLANYIGGFFLSKEIINKVTKKLAFLLLNSRWRVHLNILFNASLWHSSITRLTVEASFKLEVIERETGMTMQGRSFKIEVQRRMKLFSKCSFLGGSILRQLE